MHLLKHFDLPDDAITRVRVNELVSLRAVRKREFVLNRLHPHLPTCWRRNGDGYRHTSRTKRPSTGGRCGSIDKSCKRAAWLMQPFARAVDDGMKPLGEVRPFRDFPGKGKGCGVEEPPSRLIAPIMGGTFPLLQHVGDTLHADDVLAIHGENRVVGHLVRDGGGLI